MDEEDVDQCMSCGTRIESKLWGATCPFCNKTCIHVYVCDTCDKEIGLLMDDDYCGPTRVVCNSCLINRHLLVHLE